MNTIKSFILASAIIIAYAPISAFADCVPANATIHFSCGAGTGTPPNDMNIQYGTTTKFVSSTFRYNKCTAPDGKAFGGYIISADDGSTPDVEIIGPLENNNFTFYYTSDITITARWIPNVMNPNTFAAIVDNPIYSDTNHTYEDINGTNVGKTHTNVAQGTFFAIYYSGIVTGRWKAVYELPANSTVGYIMSSDNSWTPQSGLASRKYCLCKLDTINGTTSPWVYGGNITASTNSGDCASYCTPYNRNNQLLRSLFSSFLTE